MFPTSFGDHCKYKHPTLLKGGGRVNLNGCLRESGIRRVIVMCQEANLRLHESKQILVDVIPS